VKTFKTLELAIEFYRSCEDSELKGNLKDQLLRASSSIALNLSEGNAKHTVKEKKRFYNMAYASQKECQTILRLYSGNCQDLEHEADRIGAHLFRLLDSNLRVFQNTEYG